MLERLLARSHISKRYISNPSALKKSAASRVARAGSYDSLQSQVIGNFDPLQIELADNLTFQAQRDSMDSISMSRLCKSQAAVGGAIDEISSRLIVFDYRNTRPRVRQ